MDGETFTCESFRDARESVFACGADMKSRFSLLIRGRLRLSPEYGDLAVPENFSRYVSSIGAARDAFGAAVDVVARDLHPHYLSRRAAALFPGARRLDVQHHHAHVASVLAASGERDPVIGVAFDGTGYGTDGNVWGGEFLLVDPAGWSRRGHLEYMKMPGGEAAIREPWRMALSLAFGIMGEDVMRGRYPFMSAVGRPDVEFVKTMIERNVNCPLTSSCGRLFDAVSSLLGITHESRFEAEAAIGLEESARGIKDSGCYRFDIIERGGRFVAGYRSFLKALLGDLESGVPRERIARRFHNSVAALIADMAEMIARERGVRKVALAGGVFQNRVLVELASGLLMKRGFRIVAGGAVPVNDLAIPIGQTFAALNSQEAGGSRRDRVLGPNCL